MVDSRSMLVYSSKLYLLQFMWGLNQFHFDTDVENGSELHYDVAFIDSSHCGVCIRGVKFSAHFKVVILNKS